MTVRGRRTETTTPDDDHGINPQTGKRHGHPIKKTGNLGQGCGKDWANKGSVSHHRPWKSIPNPWSLKHNLNQLWLQRRSWSLKYNLNQLWRHMSVVPKTQSKPTLATNEIIRLINSVLLMRSGQAGPLLDYSFIASTRRARHMASERVVTLRSLAGLKDCPYI